MMAVFIRDRFTHLALLMIVVAVFSAFIKNIGALAIMMPIAFQFAKKSGVSPSK
jgi:Na+/H+ antiporter NhaD/arsenite permease-like protein